MPLCGLDGSVESADSWQFIRHPVAPMPVALIVELPYRYVSQPIRHAACACACNQYHGCIILDGDGACLIHNGCGRWPHGRPGH